MLTGFLAVVRNGIAHYSAHIAIRTALIVIRANVAFPAANVAVGILIAVKHVIGAFPSDLSFITGVVAVIVIKVARVNLSCNATVSTDGTAIAGEHMPRRTSLAAPITIRIAVVCVLVIGVVLVQFSAIGALERAGI